MHRSLSDLPGTVLLMVGGGGCALLTAADPCVGMGVTGVALAFGLTLMARASAGTPAPRLSFRAGCSAVLALIPGGLAGVLVVYGLVQGLTGDGADGGSAFRWPSSAGLAPALTETGLTALFLLVTSGASLRAMAGALAGMVPTVAGYVLTPLLLGGEPAPAGETEGLVTGMLRFWWLMPVAGGVAGRWVAHRLLHHGRGMSG